MPSLKHRLPTVLTALDARRILATTTRTLGNGADQAGGHVAGLCHHATISLGQAAAGVLGGTRRWHWYTVAVPASLATAAGLAAILGWLGLPAAVVLIAATISGVGAQYVAMRWWTRWRYRRAAAVIDACASTAPTRYAARADLVAEARTQLSTAATAILRGDQRLARSYLVWHPLRPVRVDDAVMTASTHLARAERTVTDPEAVTRWMRITTGDADTRPITGRLVAIREAVWPVIDDLRRRSPGPDLTRAHAEALDAWDILGHTVTDLGGQHSATTPRQVRVAIGRFVPALVAAILTGGLVASVAPVTVAAAAVMAALEIVDWTGRAFRSWRYRPTPGVAADLAALQHPDTFADLDRLRGTWVTGLEEAIAELEAAGEDLIDTTPEDDAAFTAAVDNLPQWQQYTLTNIGLTVEHLIQARDLVKAWHL